MPRLVRMGGLALAFVASGCTDDTVCPAGSMACPPSVDELERLSALVLPTSHAPPEDVTNRFADDAAAARFGQRLFFEKRFSGPLLDSANNGLSGTLGTMGETGKVACASCHVPDDGAFLDTRSPRSQLSFASGWTHRRAPSLLGVAEAVFLMWDGRRDSAFSQVFGPIESVVEFNSSRLFVAQQVARLYAPEYESVFGSLPSLANYDELDARDAGCSELPLPGESECVKPGAGDTAVTRVVVNVGKAIQAYTRKLSCGPSRFDAWMGGDAAALTAEEQAGARLFVGKGGCDLCHSGPNLSDQRFHDIGLVGSLVPFTGVDTRGDRGAAASLPLLRDDALNSRGAFSDGDDGRLATLPDDFATLERAFRTPSLRCVGRRPTFFHDGQARSLVAVVDFFARGGDVPAGHAENWKRDFDEEETAQLVAFLVALDGDGPARDLLEAPGEP